MVFRSFSIKLKGYIIKRREREILFFLFLHKNSTFIQVFSSTSTYGAFIFSLGTKHKYGGWWWAATYAVRTDLVEKRVDSSQKRKSQ